MIKLINIIIDFLIKIKIFIFRINKSDFIKNINIYMKYISINMGYIFKYLKIVALFLLLYRLALIFNMILAYDLILAYHNIDIDIEELIIIIKNIYNNMYSNLIIYKDKYLQFLIDKLTSFKNDIEFKNLNISNDNNKELNVNDGKELNVNNGKDLNINKDKCNNEINIKMLISLLRQNQHYFINHHIFIYQLY